MSSCLVRVNKWDVLLVYELGECLGLFLVTDFVVWTLLLCYSKCCCAVSVSTFLMVLALHRKAPRVWKIRNLSQTMIWILSLATYMSKQSRVSFISFRKKVNKTPSVVNLDIQQCLRLIEFADFITNDIEQMGLREVQEKYHLGRHYYATINSPYRGVNVRKWVRAHNSTELKPTRLCGVFLNLKKWEECSNILKCLDDFIPSLRSTKKCSDLHDNQMSWIECVHCNPDCSL